MNSSEMVHRKLERDYEFVWSPKFVGSEDGLQSPK